jgi:hypothetical protein
MLHRLWADYSLSIVLFTQFALSFTGHLISGWYEYAADQQAHGQQPELLGDSGYGWVAAEWTLQNWQSEFLELVTFVVLSSFLIHKGSPESKDGDDEMQATLDRIEQTVHDLEQHAARKAAA